MGHRCLWCGCSSLFPPGIPPSPANVDVIQDITYEFILRDRRFPLQPEQGNYKAIKPCGN